MFDSPSTYYDEFSSHVSAAAALLSAQLTAQQQVTQRPYMHFLTVPSAFTVPMLPLLLHCCMCAAYRTASGDTAPVHGLGAGDSSNAQQQLGTAHPAPTAAAAAAAGYHVALSEIQPGDLLTTNYLGLGHKRLMSTPARQQLLQSKFLFKCACDRWASAMQHVLLLVLSKSIYAMIGVTSTM
jgi:hypothetical protein